MEGKKGEGSRDALMMQLRSRETWPLLRRRRRILGILIWNF